ncbi:acetylcholinesterase-like [Mytilus galloprovincialis]|uniref:acetylcholinesterase-like n=1 Tax=Mytilus galloprovincialis TaxID=29158 RepID=UPI003F7C023C
MYKMFLQCFIRIFLISNCIAIKTIIRTKTGTIEGFTQSVLSKEVKTFLGIPYAEKPIGDLRFREPLPVNKWQNIKQTKAFQKACSQPAAFGTAVPFENQSEDCLYLNAWVPNGGCINKHAMIWIYFGGFIVGDIQRFDGKVLAASSDVIVFTLSYRTGPLGFLYLNDNAAPGNMGLMDQGLAIKWIYDNIKRFGGNRNKITLFGQSAGAASINYHMFSRVTQRYFQKAIIMSAAADSSFTYHSPEVALDTGKEFATQVGCKESTVESTLQCLRSLNASTLSALQLPPNPKPPVFFRAHLPTVDALSYVSKPPAEFLKDPFGIRPIPLLIGVLKNELSFFITYFVGVLQIPINVLDGIITKEEFFDLIPLSLDANNETLNAIAEYYLAPYMPGEPPSYIDVLNDIGSDLSFRCPVLDIAKTFANTYRRKSVYMYLFEHRSTKSPTPPWFGAFHTSEISYVFGDPLIDNVKYTETDKVVSNRMINYWTTFAKTGNPNFVGDKCFNDWNLYNKQNRKYLIIDSNCPQDGQALRESQCAFLKGVTSI